MQKPCTTCLRNFECVHGGTKYCSTVCHYNFHSIKNRKGCWNWTGVKSALGYGKMVRGRNNVVHAHRFSYEHFIGPIPKGLFVLHRCDNPPCTNPAHLFVGTLKDNAQDSVRKGRNSPPPRAPKHFSDTTNWRRGEIHYAAVLTEKQARKILRSTERGVDLAKKYGVCKGTISMLKKRKTWKHISP